MTTFNPLGSFQVSGPVNIGALAAAKKLLAALPTCAPGDISRIYLHWSVGHYDQNFSDYNVSVRYDGHFHLDITHTPRDNAVSTFNDSNYAAHTYHRNEGAVGLTTDSMVGAGEHNYGPEPVTNLILEYLCAGAAACALKYKVDLAAKSVGGVYAGEQPILTHAEAAMLVGNPAQYSNYGITGTVERWDLASFVALPAGVSLTAEMATTCGNALRARTRLYKIALG